MYILNADLELFVQSFFFQNVEDGGPQPEVKSMAKVKVNER